MIELLRVEPLGGHRLRLTFSDGTAGVWEAAELVSRPGSLLVPLRDPGYFARCFVAAGGLCWPNGLELGPAMLQKTLRDQGQLHSGPQAA